MQKDQFLIDDAIRRLREAAVSHPEEPAQEVEEPAIKNPHPAPTHSFLSHPATAVGDYDDIAVEEKKHTPARPVPSVVHSVPIVRSAEREKPAIQTPVKHVSCVTSTVRSRYMDAVTSSSTARKPLTPLTKGTLHSDRRVLPAPVSTVSASTERKFNRPAAPVPSATKPVSVHPVTPKSASSTLPSYMRETKASAVRASMVKPVVKTGAVSTSYPRKPLVGEMAPD